MKKLFLSLLSLASMFAVTTGSQSDSYRPVIMFGTKQLYINKNDFNNENYVYADITGLGNPLNADGSENKSVLSKVKNYWVSSDSTMNALVEITASTSSIASILDGKIYDRTGRTDNVASFDINVSDLIAGRSGKKIRPELASTINKLLIKQSAK